jgi:hypothetical protein
MASGVRRSFGEERTVVHRMGGEVLFRLIYKSAKLFSCDQLLLFGNLTIATGTWVCVCVLWW